MSRSEQLTCQGFPGGRPWCGSFGWGGGQGERVTSPKPHGLRSHLSHLRMGVSMSSKSKCRFFCGPAELERQCVSPPASARVPGGLGVPRACFALHLALRCSSSLCFLSHGVLARHVLWSLFTKQNTVVEQLVFGVAGAVGVWGCWKFPALCPVLMIMLSVYLSHCSRGPAAEMLNR